MTDIDQLLTRMAALPPDPRLSGIEDAVLAGLDRARTPALPGLALGAVAAGALVLGMAAGALPRHTHATGTDPLAVQTLAPSTLLAEAR